MKRGQSAFGAPKSGSGFGFGGSSSDSSLSYLAEPPSFAAVSDPNVVVSLKNVLKKDSTTKAKGLEELIQHAQAHPFDQNGGVEEGLLNIWTQIYARVSIDNSRRVRELSHTLQLELLRSARKRMERHIPHVVGPWLAGLYDRDRVVARAANDGLSSFLTTPEKLLAFWTKCQAQILDYATEAVNETQDTLSDERSTNPEDAEAKYFRVMTAGLSLVLGLVQKVDNTGMSKFNDKYDGFFAADSVWKSITFKDASVRKTTCQLLFACIDRGFSYGTTTKARQAFVTGGLKTSQAGSALEYVRALAKLTQQDASIWTQSGDKKSPLHRLQTFISKGSQGSPPKFWEALDQLLSLLPEETMTLEEATKLTTAVKSGVTHREEPKTNTSYAWKCFIDVAKRCLQHLSDDDKLEFVKTHFFPLFEQFLFATSDSSVAIPLGPNAMSIFVEAHLAIVQSSPGLAQASAVEWDRLSTILCTNISGSLPEVSKEYTVSQNRIGEQGRRWFGLVGQIRDNGAAPAEQVVDPSTKIVTQSISLLESRNMKPFGAAQIVEYALSTAFFLFTGASLDRLTDFLLHVAEENLDRLAESASAPHLISCLAIIGSHKEHDAEYTKLYTAWVQASLELTSAESRQKILIGLLAQSQGARVAQKMAPLQEALLSQATSALAGESNSFGPLETALENKAIDKDTTQKVVLAAVKSLDKSSRQMPAALSLLEVVARSDASYFADDSVRTELVTQLLALSELHDGEVSPKVAALRTLVDCHNSAGLPVLDVIRANLEQAGPQSLGVDTLVAQAMDAVSKTSPAWDQILPNPAAWMDKLKVHLEKPIDPSISITSSLTGIVVLANSTAQRAAPTRESRDRAGRSPSLRMALYASEILRLLAGKHDIPKDLLMATLYPLCLSVQLATDQITTLKGGSLWVEIDHPACLEEAEMFVTSSRNSLNEVVEKAVNWHDPSHDAESSIIHRLLDRSMEGSKQQSPMGVYNARIVSELLQALTEAHGMPSSAEQLLLQPESLKAKASTAFLAAGLISGFGETVQSSKAVNKFGNSLVSEVLDLSADDDKAHMVLALLTVTARVYEAGELPVANNRVVRAAQNITSWLAEPDKLSPDLSAEICRVLALLLPCMKEMYGSFWESTLQFVSHLWKNAGRCPLSQALPFIHASLRLVKTLEGLSEPNDDLEEALKDFANVKADGLVDLLALDRDTMSQPLEIVDAMLCREVDKISVRSIPQPEELFGLVASEARDIQTAAFNLLHKKIPADQEQKSVEVLLDKTDARLPEELLSLFLDPPTLEKFSDDVLSAFPLSIRGYLLSWKLLFDAYSASSFKIRDDFTEHLKGEGVVDPLLNFTFDVLGHSAAHALHLDKEGLGPAQITSYDINIADAEPSEKNLHWLLVHLYYLTLKYIPGLFRTWYINCRSKQTRIAVESWTTKYFSPIIVSETLDSVQTWAEQQEPPAADEQELLVKVSKAAKEVTAGYEVDDAQASIVIKVPGSYPIEGVTVSGVNRVAVNERKWQSWIMTTQGVITFSNGSIVDGLQVFKRNIIGALKGQTECAICYSFISTDKRMPDKRCTTCKNLFHRTCLYKWFQSSNQNTCPLCRNPIDYLGADTAKRRQ